MSERPRIKIVNTNGMGQYTQVFTADGTEITEAIQEITLHLEVGKPNTAEVKAILIGAEVDAVITDLQTKVLPPPQPKVQYRFILEDEAAYWTLERLTPLPTYGVEAEIVARGHVSEEFSAFGRVEIVADAE